MPLEVYDSFEDMMRAVEERRRKRQQEQEEPED